MANKVRQLFHSLSMRTVQGRQGPRKLERMTLYATIAFAISFHHPLITKNDTCRWIAETFSAMLSLMARKRNAFGSFNPFVEYATLEYVADVVRDDCDERER